MAEGKKSFVLYTNQYLMVKKLSDAQAGQLFKQILMYVNDLNPDDPEDLTVSVVWENIKEHLKEDLKSYSNRCQKNKENIQKYWSEKKSNQSNTNEYKCIPTKSDTDTDTDTDIDTDINKNDKSFYDNKSIKERKVNKNPLSPLQKSLNDFISMRTKIKKPLTENAKNRLLTKLDKLTDGNEELKIAILNQSVDHCWQDIYPLHEEEQTQSVQPIDKSTEIDEESRKFLEDLEV